ncbi:MAG: PTS sugar transporter [Microbacterium sp. SCN 70-200]|uniref:PTS sugar transporter subunit IIB n=1 Tax=unclassified Microbacterium TaxID=2609290 RepID=UPI00086B30C4|nr:MULTISPECIES: PTS sugar transporter [unclassified Microbacterium]MBN9213814.1 PTS sugar transporter [Microbacterium sp.]ODT42372.1 MAG: PTS sugar transporter [Microbacterium sp. SCN 70-200]OJV85500.1 MAG: PTS sugar transporter [Microbacterium sp. 70-16]
MRILVVCGAGASSTFVAQRVRHAAHAAGRDLTAVAGTEQSLPIDLDAADVVLVGPHLHDALDRIRRQAEYGAASVVLLPPDIFTDLDGTRTLALVDSALNGEHREPPADLPPATERNPA